MTTLQQIEAATKPFAEAREGLAQTVTDLNAEIEQAKRRVLPRIRKQLGNVTTTQARLQALVESAPELFTKPRTAVFHGVKVGYQKGKGAIKLESEAKTIELIRKKLPHLADVLVVTIEKVSKDGLAKLSAAELKSIAATVEDSTDLVVIKPIDSAVDKMVDALIKDATKEEALQEAA